MGLDEAKNALRAVQHRKVLFTGSGRPLELAVRDVFEQLGGNVKEPELGRDDWIVEFPEGVAVVEVKGVRKSAAEKHAAQLEKWVAGHYERTGSQAKGILVINAWCETPLPERTEPAFPTQMLAYSESRNHCLVTGLQLLGMSLEATNNSKKKTARTLLLESVGVVQAYSDWSEFLEVEVTSEPDADEGGSL